MRSPWFTIFLRVPMGTGDYGGDQKVWRDGKMSKDEAISLASNLCVAELSEVTVFRGRKIGRLVATFDRRKAKEVAV